MPNRREMDAPAALVAAILGVVLILVASPFAYAALDDGNEDYTVLWSSAGGVDSQQATTTGPLQTVELEVQDAASVMLTFTDCQDTANSALQQQPATITWRILEDGAEMTDAAGNPSHGTFRCSAVPGETMYGNNSHADVGSVSGPTKAAAQAQLDLRTSDHSSHTYKLELSASRPNPTGLPGLPVGTPTVSVGAKLHVHQWQASLVETPEVVK